MSSELSLAAAAEIAAAAEQEWRKRALAGSIPAIVSLYTADAVFLGSLPRLFRGHDGVRQYFESVGIGVLSEVTFFDRQIQVLAPNIFTTTSYVFFDRVPEGKLVRWRFAVTWTMVKLADGWKIALHHASPREEK